MIYLLTYLLALIGILVVACVGLSTADQIIASEAMQNWQAYSTLQDVGYCNHSSENCGAEKFHFCF